MLVEYIEINVSECHRIVGASSYLYLEQDNIDSHAQAIFIISPNAIV